MKAEIRYVVVLGLITCVSAGILAYVNGITAGPIAESRRQETLKAIRTVLPEFDNEPDREMLTAEPPPGKALTPREQARLPLIYPARKGDELVGAAIRVTDPDGYGGDVVLMIGVRADLKVHAFYLLSHKETPGLGTKIVEPAFAGQFSELEIPEGGVHVEKDGGRIHAVTGATISSRSVTNAVNAAVAAYRDNLARLAEPRAETPEGETHG
jgi:Na+-translocating ferredoxin:NAD+ oxidoreductase subunit G